jgi:MFS family permease
VQATGFALESPAALAILLETFGPKRRSTAVGAMGGVGGLAAAFGPVIGGVLISAVGWRWAFAANVPIGVATFAVGWRYLPESLGRQGRGMPDFLGAFAIMFGIASLALGIVQSDDWGWTSPAVIVSLLCAALFLAVVIARSRVHPAPILDLSLFSNPQFSRGNVLSVLLAGNFAATFLTFTRFLQDGWGWSEVEAGLGVAFIPAIAGPMSILSGRLADRYGHRSVVLPGAVFMSLSGIWFAFAVGYDTNLVGLWLPAASLYAIGVGLGHAASQAAAIVTVPAPSLGIGSAMSRIFQEIGSTVAVALVITFMAQTEIGESLSGVRYAMIMLVIIGASSAFIARKLPSRSEHAAAVEARYTEAERTGGG